MKCALVECDTSPSIFLLNTRNGPAYTTVRSDMRFAIFKITAANVSFMMNRSGHIPWCVGAPLENKRRLCTKPAFKTKTTLLLQSCHRQHASPTRHLQSTAAHPRPHPQSPVVSQCIVAKCLRGRRFLFHSSHDAEKTPLLLSSAHHRAPPPPKSNAISFSTSRTPSCTSPSLQMLATHGKRTQVPVLQLRGCALCSPRHQTLAPTTRANDSPRATTHSIQQFDRTVSGRLVS